MNKQNPNLLEQVKAKFEQWRTTKAPNERIPESLWRLARKLIGKYKITEICNALRISHHQFKENILVGLEAALPKQFSTPSKLSTKTKQTSFVDIALTPNVESALQATPTILTLERQDGVKLMLQGATSAQYLSLLQSFCQPQKENY